MLLNPQLAKAYCPIVTTEVPMDAIPREVQPLNNQCMSQGRIFLEENFRTLKSIGTQRSHGPKEIFRKWYL